MAKIVAIVEGDGEVEAVPVLIRRIGAEVSPLVPLDVPRQIRVRRDRFLKEGELERYVALAAARAGDGGCIVILLDANGDCPADSVSCAVASRSKFDNRPGRSTLTTSVWRCPSMIHAGYRSIF